MRPNVIEKRKVMRSSVNVRELVRMISLNVCLLTKDLNLIILQ